METIWLEIEVSEMMGNEFITFLEFLSINKMKYTSYYGTKVDVISIEVVGDMTDDFNKTLSQYIYYQPIIQSDKIPEVSDYNIIEEISNTD